MKRSHLAMLAVFFLLIPLTIFLGTKLPGRSYYITATLIILELMAPFFLAFEGRRPQARELVVIAVMCAIAIACRVAIPLPYFKAIFAVIMLCGMVFGPEAGFMTGAVSAFVSNFFYGHGPFTPWQMLAYGAGGMAAGFCFRKGWLPRRGWLMALFGFGTVLLWIGPLLDCSHIFMVMTKLSWSGAAAVFSAGFAANLPQAICTGVALLLFGRPMLDKLDRVQIKYGLLENGK